jgi:hypothetical protein
MTDTGQREARDQYVRRLMHVVCFIDLEADGMTQPKHY